jgi:RNA polymerase sigma-70 factor (ECF subfamily)
VPDLTLLLNRMRQGDRDAGDKALAEVYGELRRIAAREMRRESPGHTLQTTALINEAYLRFVKAGTLHIENRGHFFAIASQQMRRVLVDHARAGRTQRRDGGAQVDFEKVQLAAQGRSVDVLLLDDALRELEQIQPRAAQVVELRYFGGYTDKEVVEALGVSLATVRRDWEYARSWLFQWMRGRPGTGH